MTRKWSVDDTRLLVGGVTSPTPGQESRESEAPTVD